ncbi:ABC-2 transporter permease [Mycolicibacterium grossiae]|uniref:DUF3533 domain-containing protein n=1 Tax=Mycolicibacterium grossiae TaxID=1552759 RepID=A0A1E8Q4X2_9MYCO|nr:hypothetical protein [Mycolicibacterium grossiae]OFJ53652.1 hypothetical protein BEL07_11330 [Mycolicibacterium grossiae]QEM46779.1 hypothetical protein FZ046_20195 [Mycolicibacterium grossiae]
MGKHNTPDAAVDEPVRNRPSRTDVRNMALIMAALAVFVVAMIASYSGAFAKPTLHHLSVAVAAPEQLVDGMRAQDALTVTPVADAAAARAEVYERRVDAAFAVTSPGHLDVYVAGGGGRSVANAAETVGRAVAAKAGLAATVTDVAPTTAEDPQGTVVFYAVIFLSIGASVGATVFNRMMGSVRHAVTLGWRTLSLAAYSAVLAGGVTLYVDGVLGALTGHTWQVFGALFLYAIAVAGAVTGVAAAFGTVASALLTMFLVIVGNSAAAGPVGKPLLTGFYTTFNGIVPQGSGVSLLRSVEYFGGHGAATPLVTLLVWAAAGCLLAIVATVIRSGALRSVLNYRASHDGDAAGRRDGAVLRPRVLSPTD